jgi:hypothetical protein
MRSEKDHDWENLEWNGRIREVSDTGETRHDEWRAWLMIGSGVALVALLWWVTR